MGDSAGKNIDPNTDWYVWVHDSFNVKKGIVSGDHPEKGIDYWSLFKQDHAISRKLGLNAYRMGVEWSRIFPASTSAVEVAVERAADGNIAKIDVDQTALEELERIANHEAERHYRDVTEDLQTNEFEVFLCLNHFALPLWIHDPITVRRTRLRQGPKGWVDESSIIEFTKFAAYMAWKFGDLIKNWATINEPMVVAESGYLVARSGFPPGLNNSFRVFIKVIRNLVLAHARGYDAIKKQQSAANVGLIHNSIPFMPYSPEKKSDVAAAEYLNMVHNRFVLQAVTKGWFDQNLNKVKEEGEVKDYLANRLDWLGMNYYSRMVVKGRPFFLAKYFAGTSVIPSVVSGFGFACQPYSRSTAGLLTSGLGWELYPEGLLDSLRAVKEFGKPIYITENGVSDEKDALRPNYLIEQLRVLERAINVEKIDVRGYFHWALTDNYEWAKGFGQNFGLCSVDSKTKLRKYRQSAEVFRQIIKDKNNNKI